jgi:hypothetical protein
MSKRQQEWRTILERLTALLRLLRGHHFLAFDRGDRDERTDLKITVQMDTHRNSKGAAR